MTAVVPSIAWVVDVVAEGTVCIECETIFSSGPRAGCPILHAVRIYLRGANERPLVSRTVGGSGLSSGDPAKVTGIRARSRGDPLAAAVAVALAAAACRPAARTIPRGAYGADHEG